MSDKKQSIGIFDSGFGGLTVFKEIIKKLPEYDYIYLGDNARTPYGTRHFETVYNYTSQCVDHLFKLNCSLVILACNTASAKALRTIQRIDLQRHHPHKRVLGVIRPTAEVAGKLTKTGSIGIMATQGTVNSQSYVIEVQNFYPEIKVYQQACPLWVPLVENNEYNEAGADYFVRKYIDELLEKSPLIDAIILGCTHYPLLIDKIREYLPPHIQVIPQGELVSESLQDYLIRHPEIETELNKSGSRTFLTTDIPENFDEKAGVFLGEPVQSQRYLVDAC